MMIKRISKIIFAFTVCATLIIPALTRADDVVLGRITKIISQDNQMIPGTSIPETVQKIDVEVLQGSYKGRVIEVENDLTPLNNGDEVYLTISTDDQGNPQSISIGFADAYRLPALMWLTLLFVALVFIFGGWQGIRGLASLLGSFLLILFVLLPGILHGLPPVPLSIGVSVLIIVIGSYITHGFNRTTTAAVIGMIATIIVAGGLAVWAVHWVHLTGMNTEESLYLSSESNGQIDLLGILLGGILIGLLGVLYDIAIGQAISVEELRRASSDMHPKQLYARAIRIGREHIGALVNTLAIAYVGVSLPLLLLFYSQGADIAQTLNKELFATEIVRILVGSIGLILAVPITTLVAVALLKGHIFTDSPHSHHHHH